MANITVTPQGNIYLCKTKLENDYKNQLTFTDATAQSSYFSSTVQHTYSNYTYVKKDNYVQVSDNIDSIINCNYLYYRNTGFTTKIYYCFITRMEYVNENCTRIYFETDVYQTWLFQIQYTQSFVEREHVNDDTIGLHTVPEGLETGEYVNQNLINSTDAGSNYMLNIHFIVALSDWPFDSAQPTNYHVYNGLFSGFLYLAFNTTEDLRLFLLDIQDETTGDPINSIFVTPANLTTLQSSDFQVLVTGKTWKAAWVPNSNSYIHMGNFYISDIKTLDQDYVPVNKKLLCYPYRYILVNNNAGSSYDYKYEWFTVKDEQENIPRCVFSIYGVISPGCSIKLFPQSYNEKYTNEFIPNYLYGLDAGKLPTCSWWNDTYTNWLTQNAVNMPLQALGNITNIAKGVVGDFGSTAKGITGIFSQIGEMYTHSLEPNTGKGGVNQGDLMFSSQKSYTFKRMSIRKEYAQIIDNYFSMFGYKINRVKVPNITGRTNWNYVKTINCNFEGDIPQTDLQIIRRIFDNGITLWHNPTTMLNYSNTNNIII